MATLEFLCGLIQLRTLPREKWMGRKVYHPGAGQQGTTPYWRYIDIPEGSVLRLEPKPEDLADPNYDPGEWEDYTDTTLTFDEGHVLNVRRSPWDVPEDAIDAWDVVFGDDEGSLTYNAYWLWTEPDEEAL